MSFLVMIYSGNSRAGFLHFRFFLRSWPMGDASFGFYILFSHAYERGHDMFLVEGICRVINN